MHFNIDNLMYESSLPGILLEVYFYHFLQTCFENNATSKGPCKPGSLYNVELRVQRDIVFNLTPSVLTNAVNLARAVSSSVGHIGESRQADASCSGEHAFVSLGKTFDSIVASTCSIRVSTI